MGLGLHVRKSSSRSVKLKNQKKYFIVVDFAPGEFLEIPLGSSNTQKYFFLIFLLASCGIIGEKRR